jgi:alkylhydroperoxidase family enzyme
MENQFRVTPAEPEQLKQIEDSSPESLQRHLDLIKGGLNTVPELSEDAMYSAVTLRTLALKPDLFRTWFLTEHYSIKQGELPTELKELLAAIISWEIEGEETPACTPYHEAAARYEGLDTEMIELIRGYEEGNEQLNSFKRDIIDLGLELVRDPQAITDEDIKQVREHGVTDEQLVELLSTALIAQNLATVNQVFNLFEGADQ